MSEPIYPDTLGADERARLTQFALDRARDLGLDLICYTREDQAPEFPTIGDLPPTELSSGKFAYEPYADSVGGLTRQILLDSEDGNLSLAYRHEAVPKMLESV